VNECWDYLRKRKVRPLVYETDLSEEQVSRLDGVASAERPPESPARRAEAKDILDQLLDELPERDRELLVLKEVEGFSVQELAEMLGLNVNTVKVRLFRVRGRLMDIYHRRVGPHPDHPAERGRSKTDGSEI
jgi:RNA polymerase sigma-70 factor, ECF subfamily